MPPVQLPPSSSNTYSGQIGRGGADSHVQLDDQGRLQETGTNRGDNIFTRAWNSITRGKEEIEANKATALGLVAEIREKYGSEIANIVSHDLSSQLNNGRPLSNHRIEVVLNQAQQMAGQIQGINLGFLEENLDELTDRALERHQDTSKEIIDRGAAKEAIRQAILKSDNFNRHYYNHPLNYALSDVFGEDNGDVESSRQFFNDFKGFAQKALDHEVMSRILPNTTGVLDQQGFDIEDHQIKSNILREHIQGNMPSVTEQDREEQQALGFAETVIRFSAKDLVMDGEPVSPGSAFRCVGMMDGLSNAVEILGRINLHTLDDTDKIYLNALREDAKHMLALLSERLGLEGLEPGQTRALLALTRDVGSLDESLYNAKRVSSEQCETLGETLSQNLETLRAVQPGNEAGRVVLGALIAKAERALAVTQHYQAAIAKGLTPGDIVDLYANGALEQGMRVFGEGGFGARDIAHLRANGLSFIEVARKFKPEEIQLLREQGLSIGVGLAMKERLIPINAKGLERTNDGTNPTTFKVLTSFLMGEKKEDFARAYQGDVEGLQKQVDRIAKGMNYHLEPGPFDMTETDFGRQVTSLMNGTPEEQAQGRKLLNAMPCAFQDGRVVQLFRLWHMPPVRFNEDLT